MKRLMIFFVILMLGMISACSKGSPGAAGKEECNEHGCVIITIEGPVQAMKPAVFRIRVSTTKSTKDLGVSFTAYGLDSLNIEKIPENSEIVQKDKLGFVWKYNAESDGEYVIEGTFVLISPRYKMGMHTYSFFVVGYYSEGGPIHAGTSVYLDDDGNQMASELVKDYLGTEVEILPEVTGVIIFPTDTPNPTIRIPSATATVTPLPSSTLTPTQISTLASYP